MVFKNKNTQLGVKFCLSMGSKHLSFHPISLSFRFVRHLQLLKQIASKPGFHKRLNLLTRLTQYCQISRPFASHGTRSGQSSAREPHSGQVSRNNNFECLRHDYLLYLLRT